MERKQIVLGIITNANGEVLIIERVKKEQGTDNATLNWAFPGGEEDLDETKEYAVRREVKEETGQEVEVEELISERDHPQFPVHVSYFACRLLSESPFVSHDPDITKVKWVKPSELNNYFASNLDENVAKHLGLQKAETGTS